MFPVAPIITGIAFVFTFHNSNKTRQCTYNVTLRRVHETTVAMEKTIIITYWPVCDACAWACAWVYVHIALLIQHAMRMRHIPTSFLASRSPLYFSTLSH
jgi:hypothetical protein